MWHYSLIISRAVNRSVDIGMANYLEVNAMKDNMPTPARNTQVAVALL
jgi:hypothetical protein